LDYGPAIPENATQPEMSQTLPCRKQRLRSHVAAIPRSSILALSRMIRNNLISLSNIQFFAKKSKLTAALCTSSLLPLAVTNMVYISQN
jgi:hypothetical protein